MFRIGLIDYYLDEWHAQNYPRMLRQEIAAQGLDMEVALAWAECDKPDGMTNQSWSETHDVPLAESLATLCERVDGVMILAPSFPEKHLEYALPAIRKGLPVYVDKIFAPTPEEGQKIFDAAIAQGAPLFSSSALRFDKAFDSYRAAEGMQAKWCLTCGPNSFQIYAIHQIEMLQTVLGHPGKSALRVKAIGNEGGRTLIFDFGNGVVGQMVQMNALPFQLTVSDGQNCRHQMMGDDFFERLVREILKFMRTGESSVPPEDTIAALKMLSAAHRAMKSMDEWILL